jgi:4-hydroxybenzoyl-CoA thioesterase
VKAMDAPQKTERDRPSPLKAGDLPDAVYCAPRPVRFSDCDPAGIVYTPRFIDLASGVIEELFNAELRVNYYDLIGPRRVGLGYASVDTDFFKPALMGEQLVFRPMVTRIGRSSAIFVVHCFRGLEEIMRCRLVMVTTALDVHRVISIPGDMREALAAYQAKCSGS